MENETPEAVTTEVVAQPTETKEPEVDYKAELDKTKQALEVAQKESKAHQSTASKKAEEARKWQNEVTGINARMDAMLEVFEESLKKPDTEEYEEKPQKKPSFKERLQEKIKTVPTPEVTAQQEHIKEVASEIATIEKNLGIKFDETEDDRVLINWQLGNFDKARKIAKEIETKMVAKEVDPMIKKVADLEAENARLKKIASGDLNSEKGQPVGGGKPTFTVSQINENIRDDEWWNKNKKEIIEAQEKGLIKEG